MREYKIEDAFLHGGGTVRKAGHVRHRYDHVDLQRLVGWWAYDRDLASPAEQARDLLDRANGRRQAHPLGGAFQQRVEAFQAEREVRAAFGAGHGVHLVHDHCFHRAQRLAGLAGQDQKQRLGRGDEHIRW